MATFVNNGDGNIKENKTVVWLCAIGAPPLWRIRVLALIIDLLYGIIAVTHCGRRVA